MKEDKKTIFSLQKKPNQDYDTNTHPGKSFREWWNKDAMRQAVTIAKQTNDIPRFKLDKLELHPSGYCNLECSFCYGQKLAPPEEQRSNLPKGVMSRMLNDIRENMTEEEPYIVLAGMYSEPLQHPEIYSTITQLGEQRYRFGIYTNGLEMERDLMENIVESARSSSTEKPSSVSFNISASLLTDEFYTGLLPKIRALAKINEKEGSPLQINAPILAISDKTGHDLLHPAIRHLSESGVDNIRLSFPWAPHEGGEVKKYGFLPKEDYKHTVSVFRQLEKDFGKVTIRKPKIRPFDHCFVMSQSMAISPEGLIYPCPEVCAPTFREAYSYGSVIENNISEIWRSKKHIEKYRQLDPREHKCVCCPVDEEFNENCAKYWAPVFGR